MKQTAIEWLFLMLNNPNSNQDFANKLLEQAKAMEKEQLTKAYNANLDFETIQTAEQYYNEIYGK